MNFQKKFFLSLLLIFAFSTVSFASIRISPNLVELSVPKDSKKRYMTGSVTVQSEKNETIRFRVYSEFFDVSERGLIKPFAKSDNSRSLVEHVRFAPSEFTLTGGKPQVIRFTIRNVDKLPDGESRLVMYIEDTKTKEIAINTGIEGVGGKVTVRTRAAVPLYLDRGKYHKEGELKAFNLNQSDNGVSYEAVINSLGNSKIRMGGKCQILDGDNIITEAILEKNAIQAGTTGKLVGSFDTNKLDINKDYNVRFLGEYKNEKGYTKYLTKTIKLNPKKIKASQI